MNFLLAESVNYTYQSNGTSAASAAFILMFGCGMLVVSVAVAAVIAWLISDALSKVPAEYRQNITPGQIWLLLIPIFGLVWNFFVFQRVPDSFRAYFESTGRPQPGDYGRQLGLSFRSVPAADSSRASTILPDPRPLCC